MEIREIIKFGQDQLKNTSDSPDLDTKWLLLHILQKPTIDWLLTHENESLTDTQLKTFKELLAERKSGKPLAYVIKEWDFYGRTFFINENILVPRPETENLVDEAKSAINNLYTKFQRPLIIADIGTGSGCIAVTLALETDCLEKIYATDVSPEAIKVAKKNAEKYSVSNLIDFKLGNMLEPLKNKEIDLIVSNPPYVPTEELEKIPNIETIGLSFEPKIALDGGPDGQTFINIIKDKGVPTIIEGLNGQIFYFNK